MGENQDFKFLMLNCFPSDDIRICLFGDLLKLQLLNLEARATESGSIMYKMIIALKFSGNENINLEEHSLRSIYAMRVFDYNNSKL